MIRLVIFFLVVPSWIAPVSASQNGRFRFVDVTHEAGLTRVVHAGRVDKDHLLDSAGTGVAWIDYDQDGFLDIYVVNAWKLSGNEIIEKGKNALYRNRGDGKRQEQTPVERTGPGEPPQNQHGDKNIHGQGSRLHHCRLQSEQGHGSEIAGGTTMSDRGIKNGHDDNKKQ